MTSNELVPLDDALALNGDRRAALERLAEAAEMAATPDEAHEVMRKGQILASILLRAKAPWEEAWLAGKASTLAARKLGQLLSQLDSKAHPVVGGGTIVSERGRVRRELGMSSSSVSYLARLSDVADPDFQRYIQRRDAIPTVTGALVATGRMPRRPKNTGGSWQERKRKKAKVHTPANPSLDEAYSLIVRALGHLNGLERRGRARKALAILAAMDALYVAEDRLKPLRGGYVE